MTVARSKPLGQNYAFVVVAVAFLALLVAAGLRATPGVLIPPLEKSFGWSRFAISFSAGVGILVYGLVGPFAAALMNSFGVRRTMMCAFALMSGATLFGVWGMLIAVPVAASIQLVLVYAFPKLCKPPPAYLLGTPPPAA